MIPERPRPSGVRPARQRCEEGVRQEVTQELEDLRRLPEERAMVAGRRPGGYGGHSAASSWPGLTASDSRQRCARSTVVCDDTSGTRTGSGDPAAPRSESASEKGCRSERNGPAGVEDPARVREPSPARCDTAGRSAWRGHPGANLPEKRKLFPGQWQKSQALGYNAGTLFHTLVLPL